MKNLIKTIAFYTVAIIAGIMTINDNFGIGNVIGFMILIGLIGYLKSQSMDEIRKLLGYTWFE